MVLIAVFSSKDLFVASFDTFACVITTELDQQILRDSIYKQKRSGNNIVSASFYSDYDSSQAITCKLLSSTCHRGYLSCFLHLSQNSRHIRLGIAKEHLRIVHVEQWVVYSGIANR